MIKKYFLYGALTLFFLFPQTVLSASEQEREPDYSLHRKASEEAIGLSLSDAISLGLRNNYAIRSVYLDRIAQKFDLRVAEDRFTPKLQLSGRYIAGKNQDANFRKTNLSPNATLFTPLGTRFTLSWTRENTRSGINNFHNDGASITVVQPLLRGAGTDVNNAPILLAKLQEQTNRLNLKATISDSITQIIFAYHALLRAQEQQSLSIASLKRMRKLVEINKELIDAGRMAQTDIIQTQADLAMQELSAKEAENNVHSTRLALLRLLALNHKTPIYATDTLKGTHVNLNTEQSIAKAQAQQPDYLIQLLSAKTADIQLLQARNDRLWDLSLVGGTSQNRSSSSETRNWENFVGIRLDIPIGDMTQKQAEVQAKVNVQKQALRLEEAKTNLEQKIINAIRDTESRWQEYQLAIKASSLSQKKLEIEQEKLQAGLSSNFQVLSFETDLRNAENARLNTLIQYLNAQAELDQILGTTLESWEITLND
ncbi:TolC family protein [Xenorhabdus griffiniae]|uniref:TolC family protein n=1 Tax=Xenorhabdus griffiniae TaxID=351672 RepID=A0ABY9XCU1_9GAMM|nr:TolC family protein [Xenorhabdus griffiniae]MBD1226449.1 TolC family protein [Xenorhabdus griffiniae]MBE8587613.1 TolC family protein [Xenorhabdus griffiniae]WMV70675.1 TolC family protein [Xenorhabdus griffiniae]WNH00352.1 TolC family protein [Xenorhabdus griffiniae]